MFACNYNNPDEAFKRDRENAMFIEMSVKSVRRGAFAKLKIFNFIAFTAQQGNRKKKNKTKLRPIL